MLGRYSKKLEPEAVLAAATTENKKQNVVTEEQKKPLKSELKKQRKPKER
jgi:hypothetical protein